MSGKGEGQDRSVSEGVSDAVADLVTTCSNAAHTGRLMAFLEFLRRVFGVEIREIAPSVERYRSLRIPTLRGRPDLPFGDVILEMKTDISRERDKALEELQTYGPLVYSEHGDRIPIGLVTDGFKYEVYVFETVEGKPKVDSDGRFVVSSTPIDAFELGQLSPEDFCIKLDALMFKHRPVPTPSDLAVRFGPGSPTYHTIMTGLEAAYTLATKSTATRFQQWEKNMGIVYGQSPGVKAFLGHTYLVLLSRLLIDLKINGPIRNDNDLRQSIRGDRLAQYGLGGYEGGYFTWVLDSSAEKTVLPYLMRLTDQLSLYDLQNMSGDLFRTIYQDIVTGEVRHRTGEYYTPEWLAELVTRAVLKEQKRPSIIDPACGSGTFLAAAIELLKQKKCHLQDILMNVVGIDINPMAVEIARATYLLALGKLLNERVTNIDIPVYVADSLRLPKPERVIEAETPVYKFDVYGERIALPVSLAQNEEVLLSILRILLSVLDGYETRNISRTEAVNIMATKVLHMYEDRPRIDDEWKVLEQTLTVLMNLIDRRMDSIWVFLLRNLYAPARLSRMKFDVVIGNPPWISLRYIVDDSYQDFIKDEMKAAGLIDAAKPQLVTQMEIATLFFIDAQRLYLKKGGTIAFVMPRSVITGSKQHALFQDLAGPTLRRVMDFGKVRPLFNVPSCVLIAGHRGKAKTSAEIAVYEGALPGRDLSYAEAMTNMTVSEDKWKFPDERTVSEGTSRYRDSFKNGATIYPRCFWFVDFAPHHQLGIDPSCPLVRTSAESGRRGKKPWKSITIQGKVESKYIYASILAKDMSSYAAPAFKPIVLPLVRTPEGELRLLDTADLKARGDVHMHRWLGECQDYWQRYGTRRSVKSHPRVIDWADYQKKLTTQGGGRYAVLFTASGTHLASCYIDREELPIFDVSGQSITSHGFVVDHKNYVFFTDSREEALYLVGVLNSSTLNEAIKSSQSLGSFGPRDIHKRPLDFSIPEYNSRDETHKRIVELTEVMVREAAILVNSGLKGRKKFRNSLPGIQELDSLVQELVRVP